MQRDKTFGCRPLIEALDRAVLDEDVKQITDRVQKTLVELITNDAVDLPAELLRRSPSGYARRLVYRSPALGYTVLAMVWGPGQGTPIHDHDGIWCVEGVLRGRLEITQYDLCRRSGDRYEFRPETTVRAGVGSAGRLIPPFDYHTISNPDPDRDAVTLHVYGKELSECLIFEPREDSWYQAATRQLRYTA